MKVCKIAGSLSDIGNQTVDIFIDDLTQKKKSIKYYELYLYKRYSVEMYVRIER